MKEYLIIFILIGALVLPAVSSAQLVSDSLSYQSLNPQIEQYVQQMVFATYINQISDVTRRVVISQNIQIMPQIAHYSIYQVGVQALESTDIKETVREAYRQGLDVAHQQQEDGAASSVAEQNIRQAVDNEISGLIDTPLFRKVIETVIEQAMVQQQRIMVQATAQRMLMEMAVRQKVMEEAIKQHLQAAYQNAGQQSQQGAVSPYSQGIF